ncbi:hypothetical protein EBS02_03755 [bacterium]|nr:hypothetical protein [bacterium]
MAYKNENSEEPLWIKVVGDFATVKDLQKVLDNLDIDFGDDSRLVAKNNKSRGLHVIKDPEVFEDYEADAVKDLLAVAPGVDEVYFSFELEASESFSSY